MIEGKTLQLMSDEVHHLLTDPSFCVLPASPQIDSAFLFLTSCMPSTAEYVLCALLLAGALGGGGAVVNLWVRDWQQNATTARAE